MHRAILLYRQRSKLFSCRDPLSAGINKAKILSSFLLMACLLAFSSALGAQDPGPSVVDKPPSLKMLKGVVDKVEMTRGQGPAIFLLKEKNGNSVQVQLGPVRFLIQKGFNLSAQDEIEVRGLEMVRGESNIFVAAEIKNLTRDQNLRLRDEQFRPLWRGGPFGRRGQGSQ
jgi:hypothetical protein